MAPHIQTPVKGFTGTVVGVDFKDGIGETDDEAALAYFERQGYDVTPHCPPGCKTPPADGDKGKEPSPKEKLQAEAKALGLDDSGKIDDLKARIAEHKAAAEQGDGKTPPADGDKGKEPA
ncbi:SAP domain-containing protein [Leucobacter sp.]